jgi:FKBP-type peptidyl-prolyl cis-trans isomerase
MEHVPLSLSHRAPRRRILIATTAAVVGLAFALTGCTGSGSGKLSPSSKQTSIPTVSTACVSSGSASDSVKVTGDWGAPPNVSVNAPLKVTSTQRTVVIEGKGDVVKPESIVNLYYTLYNGTTGLTGDSTGYGSGKTIQVPVSPKLKLVGLFKSLNCAKVGSRIVGVVPAAEAFGSDGNASAGIEANQVAVFVLDVVSIIPTQASGDAVQPEAGFPTVTVGSDGKPTLQVPAGFKPPAKTQVETLIKGNGTVVGAADTVLVQYQGTDLATGRIFDQTWGASPASFAVTGVVPGFGQAIVGQTVGSRVLVLIAPADGYGPQGGNSSAGIGKDDTLAFVIDILSTGPTLG